jgi:glycosyltransferase involved in cell wall biosynthesis
MQPQAIKITAIVSLYNGQKYICEAIESLKTADEIIVVDDGSTDDGASLVEREYPTVKLIRKSNGGVSSARNLGLKSASNEFILFLDQDDFVCEGGITVLVDTLLSSGDGDVVYGDYFQVDIEGKNPVYVRQPDVSSDPTNKLLWQCCSSTVCCLFRRSRLLAAEGFDEDMMGCEDWDLYLRLAQGGACFRYTSKPIYSFRFYPFSTSKSFWTMWHCFRQFEKKHRAATVSSQDGKRLEVARRDRFLDDNLRHLYGAWDENCDTVRRRINRAKVFIGIAFRDVYLALNLCRRALRSLSGR